MNKPQDVMQTVYSLYSGAKGNDKRIKMLEELKKKLFTKRIEK